MIVHVKRDGDQIPVECKSQAHYDQLVLAHGKDNVILPEGYVGHADEVKAVDPDEALVKAPDPVQHVKKAAKKAAKEPSKTPRKKKG